MSECLNCGKTLKEKRQIKFCCSECQREFIYKNYISEWKLGKKDGFRGEYSISNYIKRYLREKYDNKCSICGWSKINPYTNKVPLEVDHIDGDFRNNKEDNLRLVCPNCHSLTPTYKGANKGNGRKDRKKYYITDANPEQETLPEKS